jgi:myosin-5
MNDISATEVHYVRCIKPNSIKSNKTFELSSVVHQLRCAGVVEAIRITRAAFPNKMSHERFLRRFVLMKSSTNQKTSAKNVTTVSSACIELAQQLLKDSKLPPSLNGVPNYVVGKTLIYFGKDVLEYFEQKRTLFVHNRAILIQCVAKAWITRRHFKRYRAMIIKLQALHRRNLQRKVFLSIRAKAILTQSIWRGYATRCGIYLKYREHMAIRIQSFVRQDQANKRYTRFRNAIIKIQSKMKMKKQVNKYQVLRKEKKEQEIMENEVELLKQRLEEEKIARLEIEAQNNSLQQELQEARVTMQILPPIPSQTEENNRKSFVSNRSSKTSEHDDAKLLDDSERMIDYFRKEWNKSREMVTSLTQENENLKAENKKVKEAYAAAGASFAALNQHNKQQSKANLRLMSTHAALIKSQEEKMKKYQKQITDLKEELRIQKNVYSNELTARMHQQDLLKEIVHLAESHGVAEEIVAKLRAMTTTKIGSSNLPVNIRSGYVFLWFESRLLSFF